jgi:hypothetical protein
MVKWRRVMNVLKVRTITGRQVVIVMMTMNGKYLQVASTRAIPILINVENIKQRTSKTASSGK